MFFLCFESESEIVPERSMCQALQQSKKLPMRRSRICDCVVFVMMQHRQCQCVKLAETGTAGVVFLFAVLFLATRRSEKGRVEIRRRDPPKFSRSRMGL